MNETWGAGDPLVMRNAAIEHLASDEAARKRATSRAQHGPDLAARVVIVSTTRDPHADILVDRLTQRGVRVTQVPIDSPVLGFSIAEDRILLGHDEFGYSDTSPVYLCRTIPALTNTPSATIKEHLINAERYAVLEGLYNHPGVAWATSPGRLREANNKVAQLTRATQVGLTVPAWCVTQHPAIASRFLAGLAGQSVGIKPLSNSVQQSTHWRLDLEVQRYDRSELSEATLAGVSAVPTLLQQWVDKCRELRVTVVDRDVFTVAMRPRRLYADDWSRLPADEMEYEIAELDPITKAAVLDFVDRFELHYAAIDLVQSEAGQLFFLENNPVGAWYWLELATGLPITEAIVQDLIRRAPAQ